MSFLDAALRLVDRLQNRSQSQNRAANQGLIRRTSAPHPLPTANRRPLTPNNDSRSLQPQSPLFAKLPPEIRLQIFTYVLGGLEILLTINDQRLCLARFPPAAYKAAVDRKLLSLLLACQRTYSEAVHLLYTLPSFLTAHPDVPLFLPSLLLPSRLSLIRHIDFSWTLSEAPHLADSSKKYRVLNERWLETWRSLARMEGLEVLLVQINSGMGWAPRWREEEGRLWEAVRMVGKVRPRDGRRFVLQVDWEEGGGGGCEGCEIVRWV